MDILPSDKDLERSLAEQLVTNVRDRMLTDVLNHVRSGHLSARLIGPAADAANLQHTARLVEYCADYGLQLFLQFVEDQCMFDKLLVALKDGQVYRELDSSNLPGRSIDWVESFSRSGRTDEV